MGNSARTQININNLIMIKRLLLTTFSLGRAQRANHAMYALCRGEKTTVAKKPTVVWQINGFCLFG